MRRHPWLLASLALAASLAAPAARAVADESNEPRALGEGRAYEVIGRLAVLHEGRIKPLDTLAREEVKQIFGRETIKLLDAADPVEPNRVVETWAPVAALFDWSVRPEFWDERPFILVEYVPLKRFILAGSIRSRIDAILEKKDVPTADRDALKALADDPALATAKVRAYLARSGLAEDDEKTLATLAAELAEEHKWLTPKQLEDAVVTDDSSHKHSFREWFGEVVGKKRRAEADTTGSVRLSEVEKRGYEVGTRLVHYQALRDRAMRSVEPFMVMPRPSTAQYLGFLAKTVEKARKRGNVQDLSFLELDGAKALDTYWNELASDEREVPGVDPKFDDKFRSWLEGSSAWVPLRALLDAKPEELAEAGYPTEAMTAFLTTFKDLERAEDAAPGAVDEAKAEAFVAAARTLGESVNRTMYPTVAMIDRETYFNEANPFWKAPMAYGLATALLAASLGFLGMNRKSLMGRFGRGLYVLGMVGLVAGIAYETIGFHLRVRISGWAPVTNMYETVIWVSLVTAVMGLVFEGIFRKVFAALAGSAVALLGTVLAANVPLLDPDIKQLQPVLRSNYWLTIHVLTEVSSYGAFLMAACLGLIATMYYLTATYRRSPKFLELALPLLPAAPLLAAGVAGLMASNGSFGPEWATGDAVLYVSYVLAGVGGMLAITGVGALLGEAVARLTFRDTSLAVASGEVESEVEAGSAIAREPAATVAAFAAGGPSTATLTRPTVAEIRARAADAPPPVDARTLAMRETAATIKPLSNFIYRTMQVGVLLIAAGTILGGIWADYSWGRFWGWDPKEVWALITLLVYLVPLHGRFAGWINTFALVFASIVCSMSVIMAWYGVNFVLGVGLHSYGFVEGGGQGIVMAVCAAVIALPMAAGWRRWLGSRGDAPAFA